MKPVLLKLATLDVLFLQVLLGVAMEKIESGNGPFGTNDDYYIQMKSIYHKIEMQSKIDKNGPVD